MQNLKECKQDGLGLFVIVGLVIGSAIPAMECRAGVIIAPKRISSKIVDLRKVQTIFMVAGMATLIEIPGPVTGIRIGNPEEIQYFKPEKPDNEVTLVLKDVAAKPTNLIIRSGQRKYIFDIVPSKSIHQDMIEVVAAYGGPELEGSDAELLDSSDSAIKGVKKK